MGQAVTIVQPGAVVSPPPKGTVWGRVAYATAVTSSIADCAHALDAAQKSLRLTEAYPGRDGRACRAASP